MHTKNGRPLQVKGDTMYSQSGLVLGRVRKDKLFDQNGRYVGTVIGNRLVFRSQDSSQVAPSFSAAKRSARALINRPRCGVRGDEPDTPD
jgi:hypothetical protein